LREPVPGTHALGLRATGGGPEAACPATIAIITAAALYERNIAGLSRPSHAAIDEVNMVNGVWMVASLNGNTGRFRLSGKIV
jgi:hypothetical protein